MQEAEAAAVERLEHVKNELRMKNNAYEKQEQEVNAMTSIIVDHMNTVLVRGPDRPLVLFIHGIPEAILKMLAPENEPNC